MNNLKQNLNYIVTCQGGSETFVAGGFPSLETANQYKDYLLSINMGRFFKIEVVEV